MASAQRGSPSPGPLPLPKRAFFGRMERYGDTAAFPAATVPRKYEEKPSRSTLKTQQRTNQKARHSGGLFGMYGKAGWQKTVSPNLLSTSKTGRHLSRIPANRIREDIPKSSLSSSDTRNSQQHSDTPARRGAVGSSCGNRRICKPHGLSFRGKNAFFVFFGRTALCYSPPYDLPFQK